MEVRSGSKSSSVRTTRYLLNDDVVKEGCDIFAFWRAVRGSYVADCEKTTDKNDLFHPNVVTKSKCRPVSWTQRPVACRGGRATVRNAVPAERDGGMSLGGTQRAAF